jgi:hypothetical protein
MCNERFNLFLAECQEKVLTGVLCLSTKEEILILISLLIYLKKKSMSQNLVQWEMGSDTSLSCLKNSYDK